MKKVSEPPKQRALAPKNIKVPGIKTAKQSKPLQVESDDDLMMEISAKPAVVEKAKPVRSRAKKISYSVSENESETEAEESFSEESMEDEESDFE